jgi:hypothetical protein
MSTLRESFTVGSGTDLPLAPNTSPSADSLDSENINSRCSDIEEKENHDSFAVNCAATDLPTKHADRPPGGVAQRQMRRFAKSADKRQSVHMLGSIEHLKYHFVSLPICIYLESASNRPNIQLKFGLAAQET